MQRWIREAPTPPKPGEAVGALLAKQLLEAFPDDAAPKYLICDRTTTFKRLMGEHVRYSTITGRKLDFGKQTPAGRVAECDIGKEQPIRTSTLSYMTSFHRRQYSRSERNHRGLGTAIDKLGRERWAIPGDRRSATLTREVPPLSIVALVVVWSTKTPS